MEVTSVDVGSTLYESHTNLVACTCVFGRSVSNLDEWAKNEDDVVPCENRADLLSGVFVTQDYALRPPCHIMKHTKAFSKAIR